MRIKSVVTLLVAVAAGSAAATCTGDQPFAPRAPLARSTTSHILGGLVGATHVIPLQRTMPLEASESVSATLGIAGGSLSLPNAGLTIVVPPFSLSAPTTITVTAHAGSDVAYDFAPH